MRKLLLKSLRDLIAMRGRAVAIILIVGTGISIFSGSLMTVRSLFYSRDSNFEQLNFADLEVRIVPADDSELPNLEGILGVKSFEKQLIFPANIELKSGKSLAAIIQFVKMSQPPKVNKIKILSGDFLSEEDPSGVIVERQLSDIYGYSVGDKLTIDMQGSYMNLHVRGIGISPQYFISTINPYYIMPIKGSLGIIFMSMKKIEEIFGYPLYNTLLFSYERGIDPKTIERRIRQRLSGLEIQEVTPREEHISYKFIQEDLTIFKKVLPSIVLIFDLVAFIVSYITLNRLVISQRKEIGVLEAIGFGRSHILGSYLLLGTIIGILGGLIGSLFSFWIRGIWVDAYGKAVGLPEIISITSWKIILEGIFLGMITVDLAILIPVWNITRILPQDAIRETSRHIFKGVSRITIWLELLLLSVGSTFVIRSGWRNLFRRKWLTVTTVLGMGAAIALAVSTSISMTSFINLIDDYVNKNNWDIMADFDSTMPKDTIADIGAINGVQAVQPYLKGFGQMHQIDRDINFQLVGLGSTVLFAPRYLHGNYFTSEHADEVLIPDKLAAEEGVKLGENITVKINEQDYPLTVVGILANLTYRQAYVPLSVAERLLNKANMVSGAYLSVNKSVISLPEIEKKLYGLGFVGKVFDKNILKTSLRDMIDDFLIMLNTTFGLSIFVAILFCFASLILNLLEREEEYATIQSLGFSDGIIAKTLLFEVMVQGVIALILAVPLALAFSKYFIYVANRAWDIGGNLTPCYTDFLKIFIPSLLFLPIAAVPGLKFIFSINIPEAVKKRVMG